MPQALENMIFNALEKASSEEGYSFVIFIDEKTDKFVQFLTEDGLPIIFDIAFRFLGTEEQGRAISFFKKRGESKPDLVKSYDLSHNFIGSSEEWHTDFDNLMQATEAVIEAFSSVFLLSPENLILKVEFGDTKS